MVSASGREWDWNLRRAAPGAGQGTGPGQSRVSSQVIDGAGAVWLASRVMWRTWLPTVTVAWARDLQEHYRCPHAGHAVLTAWMKPVFPAGSDFIYEGHNPGR